MKVSKLYGPLSIAIHFEEYLPHIHKVGGTRIGVSDTIRVSGGYDTGHIGKTNNEKIAVSGTNLIRFAYLSTMSFIHI